MSALESTCRRRPVSREGRLSGEEYSNVPVLPDRTSDVLILSLDVPKSDNMALGLEESQSLSNSIKEIDYLHQFSLVPCQQYVPRFQVKVQD